MLLKGIAVLSLLLSVLAASGSHLWLLPVYFLAAFLGLLVAAFVFLVIVCAFVDTDKPQAHDSRFHRWLVNLYIEALIPLVRLSVDVAGLEKIPADGRFLLVCNHQNEADPAILMHYFRPHNLAFVAKKEVETMFLMGKLMHKLLCQPVNRENDREALKTILRCIQLLKDDAVSVGIFPEGGIFEKDKLHHFRSGVFKIAQKANVPIVVCTLKGTSDLFHNMKRLKPTRVRLHLLDVIPPEALKGRTTVDIADQVYGMMLSDLGSEYAPDNLQTP